MTPEQAGTRRERSDRVNALITALRAGIATLQSSPFTCRKAGNSPFLRELIIPFGRSGYVALFEIENNSTVAVVAVRHQLEDDYH
jgi:plasmid stabilization system protein ParE